MLDKIKTINTNPEDDNYWTPLQQEEEEKKEELEHINMIHSIKTKPKGNKWMRRVERQRATRHLRDQQNIIIDSGATSHFMSEDLNLPKTGPSQIEVFLPDDSKLQSTSKTQLPFDQLDPKVREADILPGLKK